MKIRNRFFRLVWDLAVIVFGCALYAAAFNCFFEANRFAVGGFTGVAQILHRLVPELPVGVTVFFLNLPLIMAGVKKQGIRMLFTTVFAIAVSSGLIDALAFLRSLGPLDDLLACVFGSVLLGTSLGLMMLKNATTGGTELLARILKYKFRHLSIGRLCLLIDLIVVSLYALTFGEVENALYGMIAMFISSKVMDMVIYGSVTAKLAVIISDQSQAITQKLLAMELGVTVLDGEGAWTGTKKNVLLCVFKRHHIAAIKAAAATLDPGVFFIVCDAREVLGEGFGAYSEDSL